MGKSVYEAANERLDYLFKNFENIVVSFSGGKDSGVLLNLSLNKARKLGRKLVVYHLDYEGQYQETIKFVEKMFLDNLDVIEPYWVCLPLRVGTAASMTQQYWYPWEKPKKEIWVREMPSYDFVINEDNHPFDFSLKIDDYSFNDKFMKWFAKNHEGKTADLIGIRAQESLSRYSATHNRKEMNLFESKQWTKTINDQLVNAYPLYDWKTSDIWVANAREEFEYNKLYDLYYLAGMPIENMRVASPYLSQGITSLHYYQAIEPNTWGKIVGRVNGANFSAIYANTSAMAGKKITLPEGHTWKSYVEFLLSTLPKGIRENYERKFATSIKYWTEDAGALPVETIQTLKEMGYLLKDQGLPRRNARYNIAHHDVKFGEYPDDVNIQDFASVPSYKRMAITILKNDYSCKYMGFGQTKGDLEKRKKAMEKYANLI